ncbi:MAG: hypothetical protein Q7K39_01640 [Candidatus Magasanikbacteria bacterium]|nr:hypothetical protein [Candidatus Magasanikbacteria bacterium]
MKLWDYKITKNWRPKTAPEWRWFLERKINYGELRGLDPLMIKKFLPKLHIDPGKKLALVNYFEQYGA